MDLLFFLIFLSISISFYFCYRHNASMSNTPLKTYPLLGNIPDFLINRHRFLEWTTNILAHSSTNTFTFRRPGKYKGVVTANPLNIEYMLKTNFQNYPKGDRFIGLLQDLLGQGIFNSDGELWHIQRKTASFEFSTKSLRNFAMQNVRKEIQTRLIPVLQKAASTTQRVDMQDILERFAFDNICLLAFNVDPGCLSADETVGHDFMRAFDEATRISADRFLHAVQTHWKIKKLFNIGSEKKLKESVKKVHDFADKIIQSKMNEGKSQEADLLSRFIATSDETESKSAEFLRDVVISFILAGRDTTSSALSWFFWLLSVHPHVENNILSEVKTRRECSGKSIGDLFEFEELKEMHYLHAAISEAMRLHPPVALDFKACLKDDVMPDGTFVGKGWFVVYNSYAMGRMENIWGKDCREFVPERWLENGVFKVESPFRFPIFNAGPRICLGKDMAYIQMKYIAASIIEQFEIDVAGKHQDCCPGYVLSLTLRMKDGLVVRVKERSKTA